MAKIRNRDDFKTSILLRMGEPVVNLVVQQYGTVDCAVTSTTGSSGSPTQETSVTGASGCPQIVSSVMNQLDLVVDDALDYFRNASSGASNEEDILLIELQKGKSVYSVCDDVLAVRQPLMESFGGLGSNFDVEEAGAAMGLFSMQNSLGGSRGIYGHSEGSYDVLLTTEIALEYASLVQMRYQKKYETQFQEYSKEIIVYPTPRESDHKKVIACIVTREVPDEKCFRDLWLQRYATALLSRAVAVNTSMYDGVVLPGGISYNSQFYDNFAESQIEKLEDDLMSGKYGNSDATSVGSFFTG